MLNNFKTCHNTGTIKLQYENRIKQTELYSSLKNRDAIMRRWHLRMIHKEYYVLIIPDCEP